LAHSEAEQIDYGTKSPNPIKFSDIEFGGLSPIRNRDGIKTYHQQEFKISRNVNTLNTNSNSNNLVSGTFDGTKTNNKPKN
jgi:hypothetical protein